MGMFNSIFADMRCPVTQNISKDTEIQIKWQRPRSRTLNAYHQGNLLDDLEETYNNVWIRTDYICDCCSRHTTSKTHGVSYIKTDDQQRHDVFIRIEHAVISEILTSAEFTRRGITTFIEDW